MKRKFYTPIIIDLMILVVEIALLIAVIVNTAQNHMERKEIQNLEVVGALYTADVKQLAIQAQELSVEPKEASKYVVHEMTPEELAEEEYDDSLELLAICVEAEAGNQDFYGKCLVIDTILHRVDSDQFPNDITSVITQDNQFESYSNGHMDAVWEPSEETYRAVKSELMDRTDYEVLFFTEGRYNPYCTPLFKYGDHYFGK